MIRCACMAPHPRRRVVLTGGPGAGKTALLELVRQSFCAHVQVLPESASIVFGGGFPREDTIEGESAAQRAIFHVQRELEAVADSHVNRAVVLCDRGTVDGVAYWPGSPGQFWTSVQTTIEAELGRYDAVIHLRTPAKDGGYNHQNPLRIESAMLAADIDARILEAWKNHPRRFIVESSVTFMEKATRALEILRLEVPECCRARMAVVPGVLVTGDRGAGHETS